MALMTTSAWRDFYGVDGMSDQEKAAFAKNSGMASEKYAWNPVGGRFVYQESFVLNGKQHINRYYEGALVRVSSRGSGMVQAAGGMQTDPLMDQLNAHLDQYHIGTLLGLEYPPTFYIDRYGAFTTSDNPGLRGTQDQLQEGLQMFTFIHPLLRGNSSYSL